MLFYHFHIFLDLTYFYLTSSIDSPYQHLEKATVLQECRVFHDAAVVTQNPRKCCLLITKMLFLLVKGDVFTSTELQDVFFGVTKLFQSDDVNLRRMMYLFIKEIAETCDPNDVIIVTSSLTKDMNTGEDLYRANSMRVLAKIIDATMLGAIERYMKQAIIDKNAFVASAALTSGLHLFDTCPDIVRRWINEVQEAVNSSSDMVQYHALSLLYSIKMHDKLAVSKIVQQLSRGSLRSALATSLLIRYTSNLLHEDLNATSARDAYQFLENCLRHKNEIVIYEAAKAICNLPGVDPTSLQPAVTVLQLFLSSPKPSLRFAAMRTLSDLASLHPISVSKCNEDMESLVSDPNRSIATLAITTLLKTGSEGSVDRLMKQISSFMGEIGDEFKIVVVKAIKDLCLKYPAKHRVMVSFLATFLREEGGYEFKKSIVDSIVTLMNCISETKEASLLYLCEFIEDCEFSELIVQVLHLIGQLGLSTLSPSKYIRFIYNRIILENASVRAAAVNTLGTFAMRVPELRPSLVILLQRSLNDDDDEVRDRTAIILKSIKSTDDQSELNFLMDEPLPMTFSALDRSVRAFMAHPSASSQDMTLASLPVVEESSFIPPPTKKAVVKKAINAAAGGSVGSTIDNETTVDPASELYKIPELAQLGRAFRSTAEIPLTETEMEYVVTCCKHIFDDHIVLQFKILNTIDDQKLVNVYMETELNDDEAYENIHTIPALEAKYGEHASTYVVLQRKAIAPLTISCELHFNVIQVDPSTGEVEGDEEGYDDTYAVEAVEVNISDHMAKVSLGDFRRNWEQLTNEGEVLEKFALQFKKIDEAVLGVIDLLSMQACDGTGNTQISDGKRTHTLHLSGVFLGNISVLVRAGIQLDDTAGVILKIAIRSSNSEVSQLVSECIR
jgi:coatomer subunit gamma